MASRRPAIQTSQSYQPLQPLGWPLPAYRNLAVQARQEADRQRLRADRLAAANRRLVAWSAVALTFGTAIGAGLALLALVIGYAVGVGLVSLVRP
jgi:hypothetical protein